jgi:agmatinase
MSVVRYGPPSALVSPRFVGVPTFARLPLVRTREDVDAVFIGVPFDTGVALRTGGRFAPNAIRAASVMLRQYNPRLDVKPFELLSCVDYGDLDIVPGYILPSYEVIEREVASVVEAGVIPLLLGGDHSCTLPHLRAMRSRGPVAVIDFDAHTDAWDDFFGQKYNAGTWMRRAIEEGLVDTPHSIEVGLRGQLFGPEDWTMLTDELGLAYITTAEVYERGVPAVAQAIMERVDGRPVFISFDVDVIDPSYAPGTGTLEAGGLTSYQAINLLSQLRGLDVVGADIVEVIPPYDPSEVTANLAANLMYEILSLVAVKRSGR